MGSFKSSNLSSGWSRKCYRWNSALQLPIQCQDSRSPRNRLARICIRHYVFMHKPSIVKATRVDINRQDVVIAHRVPTRLATACPRLVISKFTRRIVREEVINLRKEACKVSATSIGLSVEWSLGDVKIFAQLTPQTQKLLADAKKFQTWNGFRFCWSKNFVVYLRKSEDSRPIRLKSNEDLERLARQEDLNMS